uniref:Ig-like domain-containing protein n=1 Tax=Xiphophorus maculatus TaxID=8083 RepID=A0A3B5R0Z4_XIPMA
MHSGRMILESQSLSLKPSIKAFVFAELMFGFLLLGFTCKGESLETKRPRLVAAMAGDDVVLPCHLGVTVNPDELVVEWGRLDLNPRFVFMWFEGSENVKEKNVAYKGRTSVFTDRLRDGDVSLRLTAVKHSDNGRFRCYNPKEIQEYSVDLLVGSVSSPGVSLSGLDVSSSGVMLDCSAAGWYPEPELFWLDGDGNIMSAGPAEKSPDPDGVYTVSSRVTVEKRNYNNFTCRVQQRDINQSRETHIHVPDGFFIPQPDCSVSIGSMVILLFTLFIGAAAFIWNWRQTETSKKKLKVKANEEEKQLMIKEKEKLPEKKSKLEEELKYRNEDQKIIDQLIGTLMETSEELKNQRKQLSEQREKTEKMIDEDEKKFNTIINEEKNQTENMIETRAQRYLKLKEIIAESLEKMEKRKKDHQHVELMTEKLVEKTCKEVNRLKERKQEIEKNVEEIKKQLDEMKT